MAETRNIHQRLAAVMAEVSYIQKEKKSGMNYTIVSHDAVTAKVRPALLSNGIVYYPIRCEHQHNGNRAECSMTVRFVNVDDPADCFEVPTFGYGIDQQDKGPGKAMSYAVKYALLKALGLETGDDPDTDSINHTDADPAVPPFNPSAAADRVIGKLQRAMNSDALTAVWEEEAETRRSIHDAEPAQHERVKAAATARGAELKQKEAA